MGETMVNRVIFVDDDTKFLKSLERYLNAAHVPWNMEFWSDEIKAIKSLEKEEEAVIVLDWGMPRLDGITFCEQARSIASTNQINFHIIMLTGHVGLDSAVDAFEGGADDYLSKPVEMDELRTHVQLGLSTLSN